MYVQRTLRRSDLLCIIRKNFPKTNLLSTAIRLERLINEVEVLKQDAKSVYNARGHLTKSIIVGEFWEDQGRQRRRIKRIFPSSSEGRPRLMWPRYLIAKLGEEYIRHTGRIPKRGAAGGPFSPFERFAHPLLFNFRLFDTQGLVREYVAERQKQNPWRIGQV